MDPALNVVLQGEGSIKKDEMNADIGVGVGDGGAGGFLKGWGASQFFLALADQTIPWGFTGFLFAPGKFPQLTAAAAGLAPAN